eukprot:gene63470-86819_t
MILRGTILPAMRDEVILRFEFPERPGALLKFLDQMGPDWNITLFHYRNHGADYGRVLVGIEVPAADRPRLTERLASLGYPYEDETSNPVYRMFLNGHLVARLSCAPGLHPFGGLRLRLIRPTWAEARAHVCRSRRHDQPPKGGPP